MVMELSTACYYFRETFASLVRNNWLSLASIGTVAVSLFILGCSLLLIINLNEMTNTLESMLEINVFLENDLERGQVKQLNDKIRFLSGVEQVEFIPKEQALEQMRQSFGDRREIVSNLDDNPLPDALRVKTRKAAQVPEVAGEIAKYKGVEEVRYGQKVVERLLAITHWVRTAGLVTMVVLGIAAVFLISTAIRISVFSRRKEIGIMKFLGATNWFVRLPFLLEGMVLGLTGAFLAAIIIYFGYFILVQQISSAMPFIPVVGQIEKLLPVLAGLLGLGMIIGAAGSSISVHRFLKV